MQQVPSPSVTISVPAILKWAVAFLVGEALRVSSLIWLLIGFMFVDYATGFISAYIHHELSSEEGLIGLSKKCAQLLFLLAAHWAEQVSGLELHISGIELHVEHGFALLFMFNEAVSIVENMAEIGIGIPEGLVVWMLRFKKVRMRVATQEQIRQLRDDERGD